MTKEDILLRMYVLKAELEGIKAQLKVLAKMPCPVCRGAGTLLDEEDNKACPTCFGSKRLVGNEGYQICQEAGIHSWDL